MLLGMREQPKFIPEINDTAIPLMDKVKLLGVTIDSQLKFNDHKKHFVKQQIEKSVFFHVWPIS